MSPIFSKLNLGPQRKIFVIDPPDSFQPELTQLQEDGIEVLDALTADSVVSFALLFVTRKQQIDQNAAMLAKIAQGDALVWFAYPKGTSKKYRCDFNRDNGWDAIKELGFDTVRMVAIDTDWSALRFRRNEFIGRR